jgi:hypothetical protein
MDVVITPAGHTGVRTWRLPYAWPLLSFLGTDGRLVVVRVDHLSPGEAAAFASALGRAVEVFACEVRACFGEGEPGWAARAAGKDGKPDATDAEPVYVEDPPNAAVTVHQIVHRPPYPTGQHGTGQHGSGRPGSGQVAAR